MADESLCVGDRVCLYSEEALGFLYSLQTSSIFCELTVSAGQDRLQPDVPDPQVISFQICVANRYKLNKVHRKVKASLAMTKEDPNLKTEAEQAALGAEAENEDNAAEQRRQQGKRVLYGQVIQLKHVFTGKFMHVSTTQTSRTESGNMQVKLVAFNAKHAQFRIMPRYKVKSEGDIVQVGDQIVLESVKSLGQYLHVSSAVFSSASVYKDGKELNLSVRQSGFSVYTTYKPEKDHENFVKAGVPVRLFHKEIEAYLVAEGLFDEKLMEDVHLRVRTVDPSKPKTSLPPTSAITYWQIEMQTGAIHGNVLRWEQQVRFKHMTTRKYLAYDGKAVTLTTDHRDPKTVFRLHPVMQDNDQIEFETYCRIQHIVTGKWVEALFADYERKQKVTQGSDATSMSGLAWSKSPLKKLGMSKEMQYDDAFTLQKVDDLSLSILNFMAGMVPFVQHLLQQKKDGKMLTPKQTSDIIQTLREMQEFMLVNNEPNKDRQKLLRNLRIVELLVEILQLHSKEEDKDKGHLTKIKTECYAVLYKYLMGNSRKNELYISRHIDFFNKQISDETTIGLNAALLVTELVKDNRKLVDRIALKHIDHFVSLIRKNKNYRYLDLLNVLCVCDGVSIPANQNYITNAWLKTGERDCLYHTELGQSITGSGKQSYQDNVIYVSTTNRTTWIPLHEFVLNKDLQRDEEYLFLEHQMDLFAKLCYGRNEYAIGVITTELGYLTWAEASMCLKNGNLPHQLRAKYCHVIIDLFVDVEGNTSVLDRIKLTFHCKDTRDSKRKDGGSQIFQSSSPAKTKSKEYICELRDWVTDFLQGNDYMTASNIGYNMLLEQVLTLVHYLARFGYYQSMNEISELLEPMLGLMDGTDDIPYPKASNSMKKRYTKELRFQQSPESKAIVDAKYQALEVVDLFLNHRFNLRLERFVEEFMDISGGEGSSLLTKLLPEKYNTKANVETNRAAAQRLKDIFAESAFFKKLDLVDVLQDLSNYNYEKMTLQSMKLLNRYYLAHENLFKRAVQAQVVVTKRSVELLNELQEILPVMQRLTSTKMTSEQINTMGEMMDKIVGYCTLENEPEEPHPTNQRLLYNHTILAVLFDILSKEVDIHLSEQYKGTLQIFRKAFVLLKVMARGNEEVQQRLFNRLEMLLNIKGAECEMAEALTEVFTGNKTTCLKILPSQVQKIMNLVVQHKTSVPQLLDLLNSIVKVEELNLPLKRNQGYVMKYFMQNRSEVAQVIDKSPEHRKKLLQESTCPEQEYLVALVDMMATCAEGENPFIESICQNLLTVEELLAILNGDKIDNNLKRSYLRFLLWVYLNTAGGMIESGVGDLPHDQQLWSFINNLTREISTLTKYAERDPGRVQILLRRAPKRSYSVVDQIMDSPEKLDQIISDSSEHGGLHYILEAVFPFLQVFARTTFQPDKEKYPAEQESIERLTKHLVDFINVVGPLICKPTQLENIVRGMSAMFAVSTTSSQEIEEFHRMYGGDKRPDMRSEARKIYEDTYREEEKVNERLNIFAMNFSNAYGGINDVKTQINFSNEREYTEVGGDEDLPLGQEFQDNIACFIDHKKQTPNGKYGRAAKLVEQLDISAKMTQSNELDRLAQQMIDVKCLQVLRGLIHNEIVKLPTDWSWDPRKHKKKLDRIHEVQTVLNCHGAMLKVLPHLSRPSDDIVREVLAFLAAMLFGGNEDVQQSMLDYFTGTREEIFFSAIKNRIQLSAIATKERRLLHEQYQASLKEAAKQKESLNNSVKSVFQASLFTTSLMATASKANLNQEEDIALEENAASSGAAQASADRMPDSAKPTSDSAGATPTGSKTRLISESNNTNNINNNNNNNSATAKHKRVAPINTDQEEQDKAPDDGLADYHDDGYLELVLRILGLMCDGQNTGMQDYLREQPDNIKSVNLVAETASYLSLVYSSINSQTIDLVNELFQTLIEFASGNAQNQVVIFDNKICDYINFILRGKFKFKDCPQKAVLALKAAVSTLMATLIEGNPKKVRSAKKTASISKEVMETLDSEAIWEAARECYCTTSSMEPGDQLPDEEKEMVLEIGYNYFLILKRLMDLDEESYITKKKLLKTPEGITAWNFYEGGIRSIEILKNEELFKVYFRVKNESVLREDVKDLFKYEVERTTPSSKLRGFMEWSKDIMAEIKYIERMFVNPVSRFFVKNWYPFNVVMMLISLMFFFLIMITWRQPVDVTGVGVYANPVPAYAYSSVGVSVTTYILGALHNIVSGCVLISYFLVNHPTFPRMDSRFSRATVEKDGDLNEEEEGDDKNRGSNLEVRFFSFRTCWYITLFACSILGTVFYGYFFSVHLLNIAQFNLLLRRSIESITKNGKALLWVFLFGVIFIYIYGLIGFAFFREIYDADAGQFCTTVYECFTTNFHRGLIVSLYEFLNVPNGKPYSFHVLKGLYDLTFFIIITTIGLNIVFGIIVDTFAELRDDKFQVESDMRSTCFICSRKSYDFENHGSGFDQHVKEEHYQWAYLFFFIHLGEKRENDYTALELYVSKQMEKHSYRFFPMNRALCLEQEEDGNEQRQELMMSHVVYIANKMKEEEAVKKYEQERKTQLAWEKQHRV